jgi:hypothetical protein
MNFNLFETNEISTLIKLTKKKSKFFSRKEDVDLFHVNKLNDTQTHIVFYISDEYQFGTKKSGDQISVPFDQYINLFIFSDSPYILIEAINNKYTELVVNYIEKYTKCEISKKYLNNNQIKKIQAELNGFVKELEYTLDDESFTEEIMNVDKFNNTLSKDITIDYLLLNVEDELLSIADRNKISVNNSDEDYLIKFTGALINAIS